MFARRTHPVSLVALVLLGALAVAGGCAVTFNRETGVAERDARVRGLWSFILPGAGQIVNEEFGKASLLISVELLNLVTYYRAEDQNRNDERLSSVMLVTHLWAATDAYGSAKTLNQTNPLQPHGPPPAGGVPGAALPADAFEAGSDAPGPRGSWTSLMALDPLSRSVTAGISYRF